MTAAKQQRSAVAELSDKTLLDAMESADGLFSAMTKELRAPPSLLYYPLRFGGAEQIDVGFIRECAELGLIGVDVRMKENLLAMRDCIDNDSPVLLMGESGTGKEVVAQCIHRMGSRRDKPFVPVNCAELPESLFESGLFGIANAVATGVKGYAGLISKAEGGTLLLDEIAELPGPVQVKLLRFLNDKKVRRVGGQTSNKVDVRIITATNQDVPQAIEAKKLREDFFHRLNTMQITLWPLRQRRADIPMLLYHIISEENQKKSGKETKIAAVSKNVLFEALVHPWPGNVRELRSCVERSSNIAHWQRDNKDALLSLVPNFDFPRIEFDPRRRNRFFNLLYRTTIPLDELPCLSVLDLMKNLDLCPIAAHRGQWLLMHEEPVPEEESVATEGAEAGMDPIGELCRRRMNMKDVRRGYVLRLLHETHGNTSEVRRITGLSKDLIRKIRDEKSA